MNRRTLLAALAALPLLPRGAEAAEAGEAGHRVAVDGFTFTVPPGWKPIDPGRSQGTVDHLGLWIQGQYADQAFIALDRDVDPGDNLASFELETENTLRARLTKVFVDSRDRIQMPNGMPAMRLKVEYLAGDSEVLYQQYIWLIYDGVIGVVLSMGGRVGRISLEEATQLASTLKVVWRGDGPPPAP
ncbi:MAG TPA: hypothetical protein VNJ51_15420 [Candidatus Dormibacteraeota bacterium]|nr:hypothetical protein [Candidatus Dormibacteraeota bacterium]